MKQLLSNIKFTRLLFDSYKLITLDNYSVLSQDELTASLIALNNLIDLVIQDETINQHDVMLFLLLIYNIFLKNLSLLASTEAGSIHVNIIDKIKEYLSLQSAFENDVLIYIDKDGRCLHLEVPNEEDSKKLQAYQELRLNLESIMLAQQNFIRLFLFHKNAKLAIYDRLVKIYENCYQFFSWYGGRNILNNFSQYKNENKIELCTLIAAAELITLMNYWRIINWNKTKILYTGAGLFFAGSVYQYMKINFRQMIPDNHNNHIFFRQEKAKTNEIGQLIRDTADVFRQQIAEGMAIEDLEEFTNQEDMQLLLQQISNTDIRHFMISRKNCELLDKYLDILERTLTFLQKSQQKSIEMYLNGDYDLLLNKDESAFNDNSSAVIVNRVN